jgi:hypothetical protein
MPTPFEALTTEQKAKVESLEIAEHALLQLANDMMDILNHAYCKAEMSAKSKADLRAALVEVMAERDRMLGELEYIKRG